MTEIIRTPEEALAEVQGRPDHTRIKPDEEDDPKLGSIEAIKRVLKRVTFAPSCVDMGWGWQVQSVYVEPETVGGAVHAGWRLRTTFRRPDRETGKIETGFGRWWEVPLDVTESGVVKTAFAAAKMILEHELMESFKYNNARPFDPHNTIRELTGIHGGRWTMSIP